MWSLALASIRHNRGGFAGVFVAVFFAAALITGLGVLMESGLRGGVAPQRYSGADVVVGAPQFLPVPGDLAQAFPERALLPADTRDLVAEVPGVAEAIADVTVPLTTADNVLVEAHGWASEALTPYTLSSGTGAARAGEVVVDASSGLAVGESIVLSHGGIPESFTVVGVASSPQTVNDADNGRPSSVFVSDEEIRRLWPHADSIVAVGVIADSGIDADVLAEDIMSRIADVDVYTGSSRGDVETLDAIASRSTLTALSASFIGVATMVAIFVVASTLSLSVQQRRREFALLRAVGTSPGQIRRMVGREVLLVAGLAALLGIGPGYLLAQVLGAQFAGADVIPQEFSFSYSPLPALAALVLSLSAALGAALVAARRPSRAAPVDALRESAVDSRGLSRGRVITGVTLFVLGVAASGVPLFLPGAFGLAAVGGAALMLIVSVGLVGPWIVERALALVGPLLRRSTSASVILADANARGYTRRLSAAIVPLALAISLGCVQLFMPTTVATEADQQSADGVVSNLLVTAPASGVSPDLAARVAQVPGVTAVNPVVRSTVIFSRPMLDEDKLVEPLPAQGIDPGVVAETLDLKVSEGSLDALSGEGTIALSADASSLIGAGLGESVSIHLGDGTPFEAKVVAIYGRGLGFGDVTLSDDVLRAHTTTSLNDYLLVSVDPSAQAQAALDISALGLVSQSVDSLEAAGSGERNSQSWVSVIALVVLLGYVGLAVVNTLVMATAERRREFTLLKLIGTTDRQVRTMTRVEASLVVLVAVVVGTVISLPPLMGIAIGVSGQPIPTIVMPTYLGIVAVTAVLGMVSIAIPTRAALRHTSLA